MTPRAFVGLFVGLLCCLAPDSARADSGRPVPVRVGNHADFGRVVFELPARLEYSLTQQGQRVLVQFVGDVTIGTAPYLPRNVLGMTGGEAKRSWSWRRARPCAPGGLATAS
jgi:hypothetical protein